MSINRRTFLMGSSLAAPALSQVTASRASRPNIILFITDHTHADSMSCRIGDRYLHTPALDSLAAQGMVFSRAYCANPLCMPSRTSMFTGRYPVETKIETNGGGSGTGGQALPQSSRPTQPSELDSAEFPLMGTIFRKAGYETVYSGKWHIAMPTDEAASGFRILYTNGAPRAQRPGDAGPEGRDGAGRGASRGLGRDEATTLAAMDFLRDSEHRDPFLLVVSLLNPHDICQWARSQALPTDGPIGQPPAPELCPPLRPNHAPQRE